MTDRRPGRFWLMLILLWIVAPARADDAETPWAFHPIERPEVPTVASTEHVRNPIDAFLIRAMEDAGIAPVAEADRRTLIRRLSFDLWGLPPTPEEVEAFVADERPDAYERLVDRLLASPRYGERWARHWLDLVRYAETHGYERDDPKPGAWRYRDWVIDALNADMPYDRFITEQLAGDELPDANASTRTATALYRLGLIDDEPADPVQDRFDQLDDMVKTIGTTFLGLTIHCARCHDHKFDPIPQRDYYRILAFLTPGKPYQRGNDASISVPLASESEQTRVAELNAAVDRQIAALRERIGQTEGPLKKTMEDEVKELDANRPTPLPMVLGLTDRGTSAEPTHLLVRGDAHTPGDEVAPGFLSLIDPEPPTIVPTATTTGRRLALARWIARPDNPLTARVMVNRLWQHHFGRGLVMTANDFGAMGDEPIHPELLDWLASEFIARGWSLKALHRLIVNSAAYRRSIAWEDTAGEVDPDNFLLWRQRPQRLEAEPIRDAVLAVSGTLNPSMGGPSVRPPIDPVVLAGQSRPGSGWEVSDEARRRGGASTCTSSARCRCPNWKSSTPPIPPSRAPGAPSPPPPPRR